MPSTTSLAEQLSRDFPTLHFMGDGDFQWSHDTQTVHYDPEGSAAELLHELAHGILAHHHYAKDIELLALERDAWTHAQTMLAPHYNVPVSQDDIQDALDTYRDWLHARSTCPTCSATGFETTKHHYQCPACRSKWRVNDARVCALRRQQIK